MSLDANRIITATETIMTLAKRAMNHDEPDTRRQEIIAKFEAMATDLGKMLSPADRPNWGGVLMATYDLHTAACNALRASVGEFHQVGRVNQLSQQLIVTARVLGFEIEDAATAPIPAPVDDTDAMCAVEGHEKLEAAE